MIMKKVHWADLTDDDPTPPWPPPEPEVVVSKHGVKVSATRYPHKTKPRVKDKK